MGKQYNKAEKRRRRARYLKRKALAARQKKTAQAKKPDTAPAPA